MKHELLCCEEREMVNDSYHNGLENFWSDRGKDTGVIIHPDLLVDGVHLVWIWSATTSKSAMSINAHKRTNSVFYSHR